MASFCLSVSLGTLTMTGAYSATGAISESGGVGSFTPTTSMNPSSITGSGGTLTLTPASGSLAPKFVTVSNSGVVNIGNTGLSKATTVTAAGLTNIGTINLTGGSTALATLNIQGAAGNSGTVNIAASNLTVTGAGNAYTQTAGFTNLSGGSLAASRFRIGRCAKPRGHDSSQGRR